MLLGRREGLVKMNYLIDGHNLIAHFPGLSLGMPDDEQALIELLARFSQTGRKRLEVFFDGAPAGQAGERSFGQVRAHFVPYTSTADEAIRSALHHLRGASRAWVVVSSDRSVQAAAHEAHAQVMRAQDFADLLQASLLLEAGREAPPDEAPLSDEEVRQWLELFKPGGKRSKRD